MRAVFDHPWWLLALAAIGICAVVGVILTLFFALGRRPRRMWADTIDPVWSHDFVRSLAALLNVPYRVGGTARLLNNGDAYFPAMLHDIRAARHTVHVMVYIWEAGRVSDDFIAALVERAVNGVQVRVLMDGFGGTRAPDDDLDRLRAAGARIATFRPAAFGMLMRFHRRNHRRAIVMDGRVAYTGGAAIGDKWAGNARNKDEWRDSMIRVEGCPAENLQSCFSELWAFCTGEILTGDEVFPPDLADFDRRSARADVAASDGMTEDASDGMMVGMTGNVGVGTIGATRTAQDDPQRGTLISCGVNSSPSNEEHPLRLFFFLSFLAARERLWITTPYFVPDRHTRDVVMRRARAGVDVRILMPNQYTDARPIRQASRSYYGPLLDAGVRIYEYQTTMMHTKGVVVDGKWSVVGSANMDIRSKELNEENVLGILDDAFAADMEQTFLADLESAIEIENDQWRRRSLGTRIVERIFVLFAEQY